MDQLTEVSHEYNLSLWTSRIKECRASGLTVSKWCEQNNLGIKSYYYWMRKIKREVFEALSPEAIQNNFILEKPKQPVFSKLEFNPTGSLNSEIAVTVHLHNSSIDIRNDASEMIIRSTIRALQSGTGECTPC